MFTHDPGEGPQTPPRTAPSDRAEADASAGRPLFTIVTVCLNADAFLREALESVLAQTCRDYEYIVVDGGSTDSTVPLLTGYGGRFEGRLRWKSEPDRGLFDAMNKGLERACGRYVAFLGADDRLAPGALAAVARVVDSADPPDMVCGATLVFGDGEKWVEKPRSFAGRALPKRAPARHQSIFVSRAKLLEVGGFSLGYPIAADYHLYLRLIEAEAREVLVDEVLSEFRLGGASSKNVRRTARDYRDVRVAQGSNRAYQQAVMLKSIAASYVSRWLRWLGMGGAVRD